jgi:hypothetical protein
MRPEGVRIATGSTTGSTSGLSLACPTQTNVVKLMKRVVADRNNLGRPITFRLANSVIRRFSRYFFCERTIRRFVDFDNRTIDRKLWPINTAIRLKMDQ